jgi:hypothetical protein
MKKIPTLFKRNPEDMRHVLAEVTPGCEWVLAGEGVATRKYDGTCVMLDEDGQWWARREVKVGKPVPPNYVPEETDLNTGKTVGWEPIAQSGFRGAWSEAMAVRPTEPGTYELCGPKVNGNPEGFTLHRLIRHADAETIGIGSDFTLANLSEFVRTMRDEFGWEGVVWHHPDGRMAKLKARDFPAGAADGSEA